MAGRFPYTFPILWGDEIVPEPQAGVTHHIVLQKGTVRRGFMVVPGSEQRQPISQFAPGINVGQDPMYAEGSWRAWVMDDFRGGCGDLDWENRDSFHTSDLIETRHERGLSLASDIESSDASQNVLKFVDFEDTYAKGTDGEHDGTDLDRLTKTGAFSSAAVGDILIINSGTRVTAGRYTVTAVDASDNYVDVDPDFATADGAVADVDWELVHKITFALCASGLKIRKYEAGSWSDEKTAMRADPTDAAVFGSSLWVACGATKLGYQLEDGAWTDWALNEAEHCVAYGENFFWSVINVLSYHTDPENATPTDKTVGGADSSITALCPYGGKLYIGKDDGSLWTWDGTTVVQVMRIQGRDYSGNFKKMAEHEGFLFFSLGRDIYQYSTTAMVKITPILGGSANAEYYGFGMPIGFASVGGYLYVAFDDGESVYPYVLAYDRPRGAWHIIYKGTSGATMYGLGYSRVNSYLWLNDGATRYQQLTADSDRVYPNYAEDGTFILSWFPGSFPWEKLAARSIKLECEDMSSEETVTVSYEIDRSGSWVSVDTVWADGVTEMQLDPIAGAIDAYEIRTKLELAREDGAANKAKTPIVKSIALMFLDRPGTVNEWTFIVRLAEDLVLMDGRVETHSVRAQVRFLEQCQSSVTPIRHYSRVGRAYWAYLRMQGGDPFITQEGRREARFRVQLIEAFGGLWPRLFDRVRVTDEADLTIETFKPTFGDGETLTGFGQAAGGGWSAGRVGLITNGGFETAGAGGADVFAGWTEYAGSGTIQRVSTSPHTGSWHAALKAVLDPYDRATYVKEAAEVVPGQTHFVRFAMREATALGYEGTYKIYDASNGVDIVARTSPGVVGTTWTIVDMFVVAPAGCTSMELWLYGHFDQTIWYDTVAML